MSPLPYSPGSMDEYRIRQLAREEAERLSRSPGLSSNMAPRGVDARRVAKRVVDRLPTIGTEFEEIFLESSSGLMVPFVYYKGSWRAVGNAFEKVTCAIASGGPLPLDGEFTKEFDDTILEIFMSGSGYRTAVAGLVGMVLKINSVNVANVTSFTNELNSHKAFVSRTYTHPATAALGTGSYAAGTYDVDVEQYDVNTSSDSNDTFYVTVVEKFAQTV